MVEIINFPSGKTIEQDTEDDDVKIIHQLGEYLVIAFG